VGLILAIVGVLRVGKDEEETRVAVGNAEFMLEEAEDGKEAKYRRTSLGETPRRRSKARNRWFSSETALAARCIS